MLPESSSWAERDVVSHVPRLDLNGSNWIIFRHRLTRAFVNHNLIGLLNGTEPRPARPSAYRPEGQFLSPQSVPISAPSPAPTYQSSESSTASPGTPAAVPAESNDAATGSHQPEGDLTELPQAFLRAQYDWDRREGRARDRKSTRLNSSHSGESRMPSSA